MAESTVLQKGRVTYIEPTNIAFYTDGTMAKVPSNDLVLNPLEEYCIAVDLEVIIPNRKACSLAQENGDYIKTIFSSTNGTISFLHGTDGVLTTNFTDVNPISPRNNTTECLGIESIDIQYNSWMYPQVTIKFVDVRGSSVLLPEEEDYSNGTGFGSIYRAMFSMPSPVFRLKVKGFYGHGVTYYLSVQTFNMDLDSSSGNFGITVTFIGYMYRAYGDMPMTYICLAPYMVGGDEYWANQVEKKRFVFVNRNGTTTEMCKIPDLRRRVANAAMSEKRMSAAAEGKQVTENVDGKIQTLKQIKNNYPLSGWFMTSTEAVFVSQTDMTASSIEDNITGYISTISGYDITYKTNFLNEFSTLSAYRKGAKGKRQIAEYTYTYNKDLRRKERKNNEKYLNEETKFTSETLDYINKATQSNPSSISRLFVMEGNFTIEKSFVETGLDKHIKDAEKFKEEAEQKYKEIENSLMEEALGFTPSIENIYNLIFAHMETFMQMFYDHMDVIKKKIEEKNPERMLSQFGEMTDVDRKEDMIPPYTAFFKEKHHANGTTLKELILPEDKNLDEVIFINNLLNAASLYSEDNKRIDKEIEQLKQRTESGVTGSMKTGGAGGTDFLAGAPSINIDKLIPLTTYDFVQKDKIANPYTWVKKLDEDDKIGSTDIFEDIVLGTFALRAAYYLSTNNEGRRDAKTFGRLEAINFVKMFGEDYFSNQFFDFLDRYADDKGGRRDANSFIKKITQEGNSFAWNFGTKNLFAKQDDMLAFNLLPDEKHGKGYYPVGENSFINMNQKSVSGKISDDIFYIPEDRSKDSKKESFFVIPSRDYVNEVYKGVMGLSDTEEKYGLTQAEIKKYKDNIDAILDRDDARYMNGVIHEINGDKPLNGDTIRDTFNKDYNTMSNYYIKYPCAMDEDKKDSLFDETIYTGQTNIISKAYLFLSAIPIKSPTWSKTEWRCSNGVELLSEMLREGSYHWRSNAMYDESTSNFNTAKDPIKTDFGSVKYKKANYDETYISYKHNINNKETLKPIKSGETGTYIKVHFPMGITESRKRVLREMFVSWATGVFSKIEPSLSSKECYVDGKYEKGFDISKITGGQMDFKVKDVHDFLLGIYFNAVTIFDYYAGRNIYHQQFKADEAGMKNAFLGFMDTLQRVYKERVKKGRDAFEKDASMAKVEDPFKNKDLTLSTYKTLKSLYDKWLCAPINGRNTWRLGVPGSDFNSFKYLDSFYHNIGRTLNVNITKVSEWLSNCLPTQNMQSSEGSMQYNGKSIYEFLTETAQSVGGTLFSFPLQIGGQSMEHMANMFKAIPYIGDWETDSSSFVFFYSYTPSEHTGADEYNDDGFEVTADEVSTILGDSGEAIPAFGVTYAKQNQAFFKNITLNTEQPAVTEASIMATMSIASKGSEGERETSLFGQDLYRVKTAYSYQCEFDMMGCAQVAPLMYFQLNNVPFWRGTYIIYKVSHQITAGDMTTHVVGTRLNKYALPTVDTPLLLKEAPISQTGNGGTGGGSGQGENGDGNDVEGRESNVNPNPNVQVKSTIDFSEKNITPEKPIICLTPAHGPSTKKGSEWFWSRKLIDMFIIPRLKKLTFYDGTSYANNIQRCNKDNMTGYDFCDAGTTGIKAANTGEGYSMRETARLVSKYGSKQVISIVPHWNGGGGTYFSVFDGKTYDDGTTKMRTDSERFRKIMQEEAEKLVARAKNNEFRSLPSGMITHVSKNYHILSKDNSDGAVQQDCACILTENFFADYWSKRNKDKKSNNCAGELLNIKKYGCPLNGKGWDEKDTENSALFTTGEGWLLSDEGFNAIAQMHVEAIRRYIDSLHSQNYQDQDGQKTAGA